MDQARRDDLRLRHMLDYARDAAELSRERTRSSFDTDRLFALAIVRVVEVIGGAASRVSGERRGEYPAIPWARIIGMRNRLIHGYDTVWQTVRESVPLLIAELEPIVAEIDRQNPPPAA